MFGHIEEPWELAEHMRVVRELQERTGGITEFVPLSFIPFQTLLGRTHGVEEISREENLKHTAVFRLALGRTIPSLQASWVKMGLDAATESLRWGVNDLGGTLMEESISRLAGSYHGTRLDPEQLVAAAHAPAARPPSAPRCTRSAAATRWPRPRRSARPPRTSVGASLRVARRGYRGRMLMPRRALGRGVGAIAVAAAFAALAGGCGSAGVSIDPVAKAADATTRAGGARVAMSGTVSVARRRAPDAQRQRQLQPARRRRHLHDGVLRPAGGRAAQAAWPRRR